MSGGALIRFPQIRVFRCAACHCRLRKAYLNLVDHGARVGAAAAIRASYSIGDLASAAASPRSSNSTCVALGIKSQVEIGK